MSESKARQEAARLKEAMQDYGVKCSIELQEGRPNATGYGDNWYTKKIAVTNHHTAGPKIGLTPSLALVKKGRGTPSKPETYLPGTLANGYGGRDFVFRILNMGLANHPGAGGPWKVPKIGGGYFLIPANSARPYSFGIEWEHDGVSAWPDEMRDFMAKSNAALVEYLHIPVEATNEHKEWAPDRKVDRNALSGAQWRQDIRTRGKKPIKVQVTPAKPATTSTPEIKEKPDMGTFVYETDPVNSEKAKTYMVTDNGLVYVGIGDIIGPLRKVGWGYTGLTRAQIDYFHQLLTVNHRALLESVSYIVNQESASPDEIREILEAVRERATEEATGPASV